MGERRRKGSNRVGEVKTAERHGTTRKQRSRKGQQERERVAEQDGSASSRLEKTLWEVDRLNKGWRERVGRVNLRRSPRQQQHLNQLRINSTTHTRPFVIFQLLVLCFQSVSSFI